MISRARFLTRLLAFGCVAACSGGESPSPGGSGNVAGQVSSSGAPSGVAGLGNGGSGGSASGSGGQAGALTAGQGGGGAGGGGTSAGGGAGGTAASGGTSAAAGQANAGGGSETGGSAGTAGAGPSLPKRVLLYHFSTLAIASVPAQLKVLGDRLREWGYEVEESDDPADINATKLATLGGVGMINTCFEPFGKGSTGSTQSAALAAFVDSGGGLFGTHCASVTFQTASPPNPYNQLIGGRGGDGYFDGTSTCTTKEAHPTTSQLPATFEYQGNLDNADYVAPDTKVLVSCEWSGGAKKVAPVSWYRTSGKGRVFYTNFAKEDVDLKSDTLGAKHILLGLGWVLGR